MKRLLICLSVFCISLTVFASQSINETLQADKNAHVKIEHVNGKARIHAWDKAEVKITGSLGDKTKEFIFERSDNEIIIKVKMQSHNGWNGWGSGDNDDFDIYVPLLSQVDYSSVSANVEIKGVLGNAIINTVNGSITASNLAGRVRIDSVNGEVKTSELEGDVKIETVNGIIRSKGLAGEKNSFNSVNGDIEVVSGSPDISATTVNGNIRLSLGKVAQIHLGMVNGDAEVTMDLLGDGEVDASSVGGDISLYFEQNISAKFDIETHSGGDISNQLSPHKEQKSKYGSRRWLEFSLNGGSAKVNVSTISGDVEINKQ